MRIICVSNQKGGVGKSTLALNLHDHFTGQGMTCVLVDTDPQGSVSAFLSAASADSPTPSARVMRVDGTNQVERILDLTADMVVIDTPPFLSDLLPGLFSISDFILIPVIPSPLDMMAVSETVHLVRSAQARRAGIEAGIVMNRVTHRTNFTAEIRQQLEGYGLPIMRTRIYSRVAYSRSLVDDGPVGDHDEKAGLEVSALAGEILERLPQ